MSYISVYQSDLTYEASEGVITQKQAALLWQQLSDRDANRWRLGWVRLAYAIGAFLIIGSMTWFTSIVWQQQSLGLFFLSCVYVGLFGYAGATFWNPNPWNVPQIVGGIFTLVAVAIVPVGVYGLQRYFDYFPEDYPGIFQVSAEIVASAIALYFVPWPFLTAPLALACFVLAEADVAPLIWDKPLWQLTEEQRDMVSVGFGFLYVLGNMAVDRMKGKQDFAFWGYIFGLLAFSGGLTDMFFEVFQNDWEYKIAYGGINLVLLGLAVVLQRNAFLVFGGLGISVDIVDYLITESNIEINSWISVSFGGLLIGASYYIANKDPSQVFPFWGYLSGVAIYWGGWTTLFVFNIYHSQYFDFLYFAVNVVLLAGSVYTKQRVFLVFGCLGVLWYIEYLVYQVLWNSWYLPLFLTLIGLIFIALAIYYSGHGVARRLASQPVPLDLEKSRNVYSVNEGNIAYPVVFQPVSATIVPYPTFHHVEEEQP